MHKHKLGARGGEKKKKKEYSDLRRTVQNTVDKLDQLLHGLSRLAGQEVLLIGCVEDDYGGYCHLATKKTKTTRIWLLIFNLSTLDCHYHSASLEQIVVA